jgi:hypothetical protein
MSKSARGWFSRGGDRFRIALSMTSHRRRVRSHILTVLLSAMGAGALSATSAGAATPLAPPYSQCPPIGSAPGCAILLVVNPDRTISVLGDPSVGPYDGSDDSLIGVMNQSPASVDAITVTGPGRDLAGFDGDGLCTYVTCSYPAPTGYEGPNNTFTTDPTTPDSAEVDFTTALPPGGSTYFSLEGALTAASLTARPGRIVKDSDGDGLPDSWEDSPGRDLGGGVFDGTLHSMGADSQHKDVFLHIDSEKGAELSDRATRLLVDAFAAAPVQNPDQRTGIRLHIVTGSGSLSPADSDALREPDNNPLWSKVFDRFKSDLELHAFHYVVSVHWDQADYAGIADNIPGQLVVANNCGTRRLPRFLFFGGGLRRTCAASDKDQAANIMHELGHNLGLHHGGAAPLTGDDLEDTFKPNYLSVMNYSFSHSGVPGIGLTYSKWGAASLSTLDENSLAERDGVKKLDNSVPTTARTIYYCPSSGAAKTVKLGVPVDWNCRSGIDRNRVAANIDYSERVRSDPDFLFLKTRDTLSPHDDWSALDYSGGVIGRSTSTYPGPIAVANRRALVEPSRAERSRLAEEIEPLPTLSAAPCARDRTSVTLKVPVSTTTDGTLSWAPVEPDGSPAESIPAGAVRAGTNGTIDVKLPLGKLTGRQGVVVTFTNEDWTVTTVTAIKP